MDSAGEEHRKNLQLKLKTIVRDLLQEDQDGNGIEKKYSKGQ